MQRHEVKILSYIRNFKKIIFICPICRENNSLILDREDLEEQEFRCDSCRQKYLVGLAQLPAIIEMTGK